MFTVLVPLLAANPGCSSETGIVIEVQQGSLEQAPDTLRFLVGVQAEDLDFAPVTCGSVDTTLQRFILAPSGDSDIADISGRDLTTDPYRLLLRPDADLPADRPVLVAVGAFAGEQLIGVGALQTPVAFIDGKVVQWDITLQIRPATSPVDPAAACVCASDYLGLDAIITPLDDQDCDGDVSAVDCNDNDASVGPSAGEQCGNLVDDNCDGRVDEIAEEVCDGVDNNCDGRCDEGFDLDGDLFTTCGSRIDLCDGTRPEKIDCDPLNPTVYPGAPELCDGLDNNCVPDDPRFAPVTNCYAANNADGLCWLGQRQCEDEGVGWVSDCQGSGNDAYIATPQLCEAFVTCPEYDNQFECANDAMFVDGYCELFIIDNGVDLRTCPNAVEPVPPMPGTEETACVWTLLGDGLEPPFEVFFTNEILGMTGSVVQGCSSELVVSGLNNLPPQDHQLLIWLSLFDQPLHHLRANIRVQRVGSEAECPLDALKCENTLPAP